jgi:aspartate aminotransferase
MSTTATSRRIARVSAAFALFDRFLMDPDLRRRENQWPVYDFVYGNPNEMPLSEFVDALRRWSVPQNPHWFAYKLNQPQSREIVAESLRRRYGMPFEPGDIFVTNGAFAAISVALQAIADPGDEVIFFRPHWFFYEALIAGAGALPVCLDLQPETFDLDLDGIAAAITPRTRAIIVNSPHNPTGRIYPPGALAALGRLLADASARLGRTIYLLSDEAYSRIVYDGQPYPTPTASYPNSFLLYTYGKTLLTPGQRLGYVALPPTMPEREAVGLAIDAAQMVTGFAYPNALLQHALADLERLSIDVGHLERKRDRLVAALRDIGYQVAAPQGTFYLLPRSPWADDYAFAKLLTAQGIFCLPGAVIGASGYFRLSLTANDAMIEGALPGFEAAQRAARSAPELLQAANLAA